MDLKEFTNNLNTLQMEMYAKGRADCKEGIILSLGKVKEYLDSTLNMGDTHSQAYYKAYEDILEMLKII